MSNGEVKRWYLYTENEALYAVSKNQRGFVPDASTIEVMRVEDHDRIVAELKAEYEQLRAVVTAPQMQYEEEITELRAEVERLKVELGRPYDKVDRLFEANKKHLETIAKQKRVIDELKSHIKLLNSSECQPYDAYYKTCEVHYGLLKEEFNKAKTIIDTQKRVIEKLREQRDIELEDNCWDDALTGGRPFEQARAMMDAEIEAIEKEKK